MSSGPARVVDVTEEEEGRQGPRTRMDKFLAFMGGERWPPPRETSA